MILVNLANSLTERMVIYPHVSMAMRRDDVPLCKFRKLILNKPKRFLIWAHTFIKASQEAYIGPSCSL